MAAMIHTKNNRYHPSTVLFKVRFISIVYQYIKSPSVVSMGLFVSCGLKRCPPLRHIARRREITRFSSFRIPGRSNHLNAEIILYKYNIPRRNTFRRQCFCDWISSGSALLKTIDRLICYNRVAFNIEFQLTVNNARTQNQSRYNSK